MSFSSRPPIHPRCKAAFRRITQAFHPPLCQDDRSFLLVDFNILCDETYKRAMYPAACAALCIYAAGVPLAFSWRLRMHREVLHAPGL